MAGMLIATSLAAQDAALLVRDGFEWHPPPAPPEPVNVDAKRLASQTEAGCAQSPVRFGDSAIMRGQIEVAQWPDVVRRLSAIAALTDDPADMNARVSEALATPDLTPVQRFVLQNQHVLWAMQLGGDAKAADILAKYGLPEDLPPSLASDRLFWGVLGAQAQGRGAWTKDHLPALDAAFVADPTSFQVRAWRVIGWIKAEPWKSKAQCGPLIRDFSNRILDLSDAGACPLMIGHLAFAMDRALGDRGLARGKAPQAVWRRFSAALLGVVSGDRALVAELRDTITVAATQGTPCAADMRHEILALERLP